MKKLWVASPFFKSRGKYPLDMIIIHHIGSQNGVLFGVDGAISWFTDVNTHKNPTTGAIENQVSAHYIVPRAQYKGYDVIQCVKDIDVAYHAGFSQWTVKGVARQFINNYSIGIELEGDGNVVDYTDYQYDTLETLVKELMATYNIPECNIVGHEDISPGRKVDPGKLFDWKKFRVATSSTTTSTPVITVPPVPIPPVDAPPVTPAPVAPPPPFFMGSGEDKTGMPSVSFFDWLLKVLFRR